MTMNAFERRAFYSSSRWQRLRNRTVRAHRAKYGNWCPGWLRAPHPAYDLTGDHIVPTSMGGAPLDPTNVQVLCTACNDVKGRGSGRATWADDTPDGAGTPALDEGGGTHRAEGSPKTAPFVISPRDHVQPVFSGPAVPVTRQAEYDAWLAGSAPVVDAAGRLLPRPTEPRS